ncbi:MAG: hypothetical protein BAA04_09755 [Firmicutes bacterium ZCTH02-B6]|nr:MAG: hypothetical protein BAA04_09755 [Firmicutes bacterium ZCTH02-B6]
MWLQVIEMPTEFGQYLRQLRESRGFGVNQLAARAGVSSAEISRIENGERKRPHPDVLIKLAGALRHPVEDFYRRLGYLPDTSPEPTPASAIIARALYLANIRGVDRAALAEATGRPAEELYRVADSDLDLHVVQRLSYLLSTTMHYLLGRIDDPAPLPGIAVAHHDPEKGVEPGEPLPPETQLIVERAIIAAKKEWGWD